MHDKTAIHYCVPPENNYLIAELFFNNEQWAELNTEHGTLEVVVFPMDGGEHRTIPLEIALTMLSEAEQQLRKRSLFFEGTD